jgi:homocysteine S-methyltransferase
MVLDGGLATELEARGGDLKDDLWSAKLLTEAPDLIRQVHWDYLAAGADCIVSASYQATVEGFTKKGRSAEEAVELLGYSVRLAREARDAFWSAPEHRVGRLRPLVAASIGPYGAARADGSEYTGRYGLDEEGLVAFHRRRFEVLARSGADLLACETIPSRVEARALVRLLREAPEAWSWLSFSCRDGTHLSEVPQLVAVGVNCTPPQFITSLIAQARRSTDKPVLVYPNSGEAYNAESKSWRPAVDSVDFTESCQSWRELGAALIGGCCRIGPQHIRRIRRRLLQGGRRDSDLPC